MYYQPCLKQKLIFNRKTNQSSWLSAVSIVKITKKRLQRCILHVHDQTTFRKKSTILLANENSRNFYPGSHAVSRSRGEKLCESQNVLRVFRAHTRTRKRRFPLASRRQIHRKNVLYADAADDEILFRANSCNKHNSYAGKSFIHKSINGVTDASDLLSCIPFNIPAYI